MPNAFVRPWSSVFSLRCQSRICRSSSSLISSAAATFGILRVDDLLLAVSLQIILQVVGLLAYPWRAIQSYRFLSPLLCDYLCFSRVHGYKFGRAINS
jgi:hypothetical protein